MNKRNLIAWIAFAFCLCILIGLIVITIITRDTELIFYSICSGIFMFISLFVACIPSSSKVSDGEVI